MKINSGCANNSSNEGWSRQATMPDYVLLSEDTDEIVMQLDLDAGLAQFKGHFPGEPILPGVAQLDWAISYAQSFWSITSLPKRVTQLKFRQVLTPGDAVSLVLQRKSNGKNVRFSYDGPVVCHSSGILHWDTA